MPNIIYYSLLLVLGRNGSYDTKVHATQEVETNYLGSGRRRVSYVKELLQVLEVGQEVQCVRSQEFGRRYKAIDLH